MSDHRRLRAGRHTLVVAATDRADGDLHPQRVSAPDLERRQRALTGVPWTMLDQRHGIDVVAATETPWAATAGVGDVVVAIEPTRPVAIWAADCAGLVMADRDGTVIVAAHVGWRGLAAGIVDVAIDALERDGRVVGPAVLGPCIRACCYAFDAADLDTVAAGAAVDRDRLAGITAGGEVGLDMAAAVTAVAERRGVNLAAVDACTGCDHRWFSHRRRRDVERHALVAWFEVGR